MTSNKKYRYAADHLEDAGHLLKDAEDRFFEDDGAIPKLLTEKSAHKIVKECQESIELSAKSMFFVVDKTPPERHNLNFTDATRGSVEGLLHEVPDSFDREGDITRVMVCTGV